MGEWDLIARFRLPFGLKPFGNELKAELLTADGRNAEAEDRQKRTDYRHREMLKRKSEPVDRGSLL